MTLRPFGWIPPISGMAAETRRPWRSDSRLTAMPGAGTPKHKNITSAELVRSSFRLRIESGVDSSRNPGLFELPGSRIESGMTTKNKYPEEVFCSIFVFKPDIVATHPKGRTSKNIGAVKAGSNDWWSGRRRRRPPATRPEFGGVYLTEGFLFRTLSWPKKRRDGQ